MSERFQVPDEPPVVEDLNLLVQRAREGDEAVLPQLREMLDTRPELWQHFGNLAGHAREAWLRVISADDLALKESTARKAEDLVRELAGPEPFRGRETACGTSRVMLDAAGPRRRACSAVTLAVETSRRLLGEATSRCASTLPDEPRGLGHFAASSAGSDR